eukprot:3151957-Heterocapsa_arctica.AAC.1
MMLETAAPPAAPGAGPVLAYSRRHHRDLITIQDKRLGSPSQGQRPGDPRRAMRNPFAPSKGKARDT